VKILGFVLVSLLGAGPFAPTIAVANEPGRPAPPWEVWRDLTTLAALPEGDTVVMRSSYCPSGCAHDRHSAGDGRFLRVIGDEGVIFEETGPGAITRIWLTQGDSGISLPLDPEVWIRIVVDGDIVVQLPLPDFFAGEVPPFQPPLALDRTLASGGYISHVPIAYSESCRVSLLGADESKIWFQVTAHRLTKGSQVTPFSGDEDLSRWRELLDNAGRDPWAGAGRPALTGEIVLRRRRWVVVGAMTGPDFINGLALRIDRRHWSFVDIRLTFDGEIGVEMPLADFFAVGGSDGALPRSLLVGATGDGELYSYFPMPFFERAVVQLGRSRRGGRRKIPVEYAVRRLGTAPAPSSGLFGAQRVITDGDGPAAGHEPLRLTGRGKWVGLAGEIGGVEPGSRDYLEGDEKVFLEGSSHPQIHGTGVEDFVGGGFYFRVESQKPRPYGTALHGMTSDRTLPDGAHTTSLYRLMLTDAPVWTRSIRVFIEGGPVNRTAIRARTVAYFYTSPSSLRRATAEPDG
jgi:hypothetical protein